MSIDHRARRIALLAVFALAASAPSRATARESLPDTDARDCLPVCATGCVKPLTIPDRWDDVTPVPGHPEWAGNGRFDGEEFTDASANGVFDIGEPFEDTNGNGMHDEEAYHPLLTGYVPDPVPGNLLAPDGDFGRQITLRPGKDLRAESGTYYAVAFPALNTGTPVRGARAYREAFANCVSFAIGKGDLLEFEPGWMAGPTADALRDLHDQDPGAMWDPVTRTVVGSRFDGAHQRRIVFLPLTDPRVQSQGSRGVLQVAKIAVFFIEAPASDGSVRGRFLKLRAPSSPCSCSCEMAEAFLRDCR